MTLIVQKFGGSSLADCRRISQVAAKIAAERQNGHQVIAITSAMQGVTDQLIGYCHDLAPGRLDCEYDTVLAAGEQITAGLLALSLVNQGIPARSWLGWQVPIDTTEAPAKALITNINTDQLHKTLAQGQVAVIAGFQGLDSTHRLTTLGRGGSDTTAVAVAIAVQASRCDIYTDVDGIYTADPRIVERARKLQRISYEEMLELASLGSQVLHPRSVALAMCHQMPVQVLSSFDPHLGSDLPGTLVLDENQIMEYAMQQSPTKLLEQEVIRGISYSRDEAKLTLRQVSDHPGVAAAIFTSLTQRQINVDLIVQNISTVAPQTDLTFTVNKNDLAAAQQCLYQEQPQLGFDTLLADLNVAKISVIGVGMRSHSGVAAQMFQALADQNINIQLISTSEIKISVLIAAEYTELAVRTLHSTYGLDYDGPVSKPPSRSDIS